MSEVVNFEIKLARIASPQEDRRNATLTNNPIAIIDLQEKYPWLFWLEHINEILPPDVTVTEYDIVNIYDPKYYSALGDLLAQTPSRTLANYILSRIVFRAIPLMNNKLRKRQQDFYEVVNGQSDEQIRWKECVEYVSSKLPIAISAIYVRRFFNADAKRVAQEMVENLKEVVRENLQFVSWMDLTTRQAAIKKLDHMQTLIGYPDELDDDAVLTDYYKDLEIVAGDYFKSDQNLYRFEWDVHYRKLKQEVMKDDWEPWAKAAVVNAFYHNTLNYISKLTFI